MSLLRIGAAQLLFLETPPHAAVATAVDLAEAVGQPRGKGLANAVLRRLSREADAILADQDATALNTPDWLRRRWVQTYGLNKAAAIAAQIPPGVPPTIRISARFVFGLCTSEVSFARASLLFPFERVDVASASPPIKSVLRFIV